MVQYQNDNTNYVPNNGMLNYEVHGISNDKKYTVVGRFGVTHPRLSEEEDVRDYRDGALEDPTSAMMRDRGYILVEKCSASAFQPGLDAVDAMIGTLKLGVEDGSLPAPEPAVPLPDQED